MSRSILACTCSGLAIFLAAQATSAAAQAPTASEVGGNVEEIVVTAQRREQRLHDVPVSVSVVSGDALERANLRSLDDVSQRLPNVKITGGQAADVINIRGLGSGQNAGFEQSVATFVDGVYRGRSRAIRAALFDIERLEVLKGPQSTFFGANAVAGAINIATRKPGNSFDYNFSALYGSDREYSVDAGVTAPISDKFSIRLAGRLNGMNGYIYNSHLDQDGPRLREELGRISFHWEPTETFSSDLRIDKGRSRTRGAYAAELLECPPGAAFGGPRGLCAAYIARGGVVEDDLNGRASISDTHFDYDFTEAAWTNRLDLGPVTLSSLTGYFDHDVDGLVQAIPIPPSNAATGAGTLPIPNFEAYHTFSQELRIQSNGGGPIEYMAGLYYSSGKLKYNNYTGFFFLPFAARLPQFYAATDQIAANVGSNQKDETRSAFASVTIRPVKALRVNLGLRYSDVEKSAVRYEIIGTSPGPIPTDANFRASSPAAQAAMAAVLGGQLGPYADPDRHYRKLMPSAGLQYDVSTELMAYANFSRGFKAGGYGAGALIDEFNSESVDAYEAGLKYAGMGNRLNINVAVFRSDYSDLQEATVVVTASGTPQTLIRNAAKARSQGVELGASLKVSSLLTLNADVAYLNAKYRDFPNGACTSLQSLVAGCLQNLSGKSRPFAPKFSGNVGASLVVPVRNLELRVDPSLYFTSRYFQQSTADPLLAQDGYAKVDLRVAIGAPGRRWELAVIGKNLTNKRTASFRTTFAATQGSVYALTDRDRSVAVQFSMRR